MSHELSVHQDRKLRLKRATGWFPADESLLEAMTLVSAGAFRLFVFLCLKADRHTATYSAGCRPLALAAATSKNSLRRYVIELETSGLCSITRTRGPGRGTTFRINPDYWPYQSVEDDSNRAHPDVYVAAVRKRFLALRCTSGRFGPAEERQARELQGRGVRLQILEDAMLVGACRKYVSWLNNGFSAPIASLRYFEPLIEEVQERPFAADYRDYLRMEVKKLAGLWSQSTAKYTGDLWRQDLPAAGRCKNRPGTGLDAEATKDGRACEGEETR